MHRAARLGDDDAIRALVDAGAPVDELFDIALDPGARQQPATPLMVAAGSGDGATAATVRLLLPLGASVEPGPSGMSALSYACAGLGWNYPPGGDAARVAALLAAGADPDVAGGNGISALARAAGSGDPERVRRLLEAGANPRPPARRSSQSPLDQAVRSGSLGCVRALLAAGISVEAARDDREPILALAPSVAVMAELLAAGADPFAEGFHGKSIAESVASNSRVSVDERVAMLRRLVDAGVDLNSRARHFTALGSVAMSGLADAVQALLTAGADPTACPSPLGAACFSYTDDRDPGMERVVDLLVGAGLDPNDRDAAGLVPLNAALSEDAFGSGYASSDGINVAAALALIRNGASVDITFPETGYRPLHAAAAAGSATLVEALLAAGADPTERTPTGETPLDVARNARAPDCIRLLEAAASAR